MRHTSRSSRKHHCMPRERLKGHAAAFVTQHTLTSAACCLFNIVQEGLGQTSTSELSAGLRTHARQPTKQQPMHSVLPPCCWPCMYQCGSPLPRLLLLPSCNSCHRCSAASAAHTVTSTERHKQGITMQWDHTAGASTHTSHLHITAGHRCHPSCS